MQSSSYILQHGTYKEAALTSKQFPSSTNYLVYLNICSFHSDKHFNWLDPEEAYLVYHESFSTEYAVEFMNFDNLKRRTTMLIKFRGQNYC